MDLKKVTAVMQKFAQNVVTEAKKMHRRIKHQENCVIVYMHLSLL